MTDYFKLYHAALSTINKHSPENAYQLFEHLSCNDYVQDEKEKNPYLVNDTLFVLDNLLDDGLVRGRRVKVKGPTQYELEGLTTAGQTYLQQLSDKTLGNKIKSVLKENGLPMTPQNITKVIAQLIF